MRVLFYLADQNPHRDRSMGITGYTAGLLGALCERPELTLEALCSRSSYRPPPGVTVRTLPFRTDRAAQRLLADHAVAALPTHADLWHFPKGHLPLVKPRRPCVGTIHDTIVLHYAEHYPETRSPLAFAYWRRVLRSSLARFDRVCTVSQHARGQIEALCAREGIAAPPIDVTHEGARWEQHAGEACVAGDKADYVLHLGSAQPHKRTHTLLQHWQALQTGGAELPPLRIVGALTPQSAQLAGALRHVTVEPPVHDDSLRETMAAARALLLPSEIEGFGLPALEGFYLGTPVVFVRGTAVEEVLADFPEGGFELDDATALRSALDAAMALPSARIAELATALRERFAWARCADATLASYRAVLS